MEEKELDVKYNFCGFIFLSFRGKSSCCSSFLCHSIENVT